MSTPDRADAVPTMVGAERPPEAFFKAQERNRRATWRMTALCVVAAFLMGIPLTLVLTPFFYVITMAVAEVVNYFSPLPPEFWQTTSDLARLGYRVAEAVINQRGVVDPGQLAFVAALILLPGIVIALTLWAGMLLLFRHGGVGGTLASLNAREPNPNDLKELQLADVVQEMAIAAGLPAPRLNVSPETSDSAACRNALATSVTKTKSRRCVPSPTTVRGLLFNFCARNTPKTAP